MTAKGMASIRELFRIGRGPSSSHTMGPVRAAESFTRKYPGTTPLQVTLYGSLAATGRGHLTDTALQEVLGARLQELIWQPDLFLKRHPNALEFKLLDGSEKPPSQIYYSVGGGALVSDDHERELFDNVYQHNKMEEIIKSCRHDGIPLWQLVVNAEGETIWQELARWWQVMQAAVERGLQAEGVLPGKLRLARRARSFQRRVSGHLHQQLSRSALLSAYALAVAEENAGGGEIVTAPTCGACGVVPSVLRYLQQTMKLDDREIMRALAIAGLLGNLVKANASISGAEVGCQGEIGTACAMASGAAAWLLGGSLRQIEYAAEMGLEHHLGLTCDPIMGLVQIPCIERNAFGALRALDCAEYALLSDGSHLVSFDEIITVMLRTGLDMHHAYRETSLGGLAQARLMCPTRR